MVVEAERQCTQGKVYGYDRSSPGPVDDRDEVRQLRDELMLQVYEPAQDVRRSRFADSVLVTFSGVWWCKGLAAFR